MLTTHKGAVQACTVHEHLSGKVPEDSHETSVQLLQTVEQGAKPQGSEVSAVALGTLQILLRHLDHLG